ncbi:MvdC/MvdD family ATP grasp protein, partial [Rheinheimera baltica]|uniref:MvdC/MvdD family ATP grasp protein n=1 Tax=Rheinheimera baltica TaxID=67576 RepID=UPI00273D8915
MTVVLAVSHSEDIHVDLVLSLISHEDIQLFRLDADCFPCDYQFWYGYTPDGLDGELLHLPSGKRIRLADITAVWLRKPAPFSFISADL